MPRNTTTTAEAPVPAITLRALPPRAGEAADGLTVTVIVCAYTLDRWGDLTAALDSIRGQVRPADEAVLVVDHYFLGRLLLRGGPPWTRSDSKLEPPVRSVSVHDQGA